MDALAFELRSISRRLRALDAMVKKAPVTVLEANLVEPGTTSSSLLGGGRGRGGSGGRQGRGDHVLDEMLLAYAHPSLLAGLAGERWPGMPMSWTPWVCSRASGWHRRFTQQTGR